MSMKSSTLIWLFGKKKPKETFESCNSKIKLEHLFKYKLIFFKVTNMAWQYDEL